ncbi:hypothetical protein AZE42_06467, partial [Rhizopogon vesiculosus]
MPTMISISTPGAANRLIEVMTLAGHETTFDDSSDGTGEERKTAVSISYFPDGKHIISGSGDKIIRRWDLQAGKEVQEARIVCEEKVTCEVAVSMNGRCVIPAGEYFGDGGPNAYEVETGIMKTFEGHSREIRSIDVS